MTTYHTLPSLIIAAGLISAGGVSVATGSVYDVALPIEMCGYLSQLDVPVIGDYACGPASAVNGFVYLQNLRPNEYNASLVVVQDQDLNGDGHVDLYDDMIDTAWTLGQSDYFNTIQTQSTLPDNYIWGTRQFIEERVPGITEYEAQTQWSWVNHPPQPEWVTQLVPTWEFLYQGLLDAAACQILLAFPGYPDGFGHWVTLSGFHWDDVNENGVIEYEEATLNFMDSLSGAPGSVNVWHGGDGRLMTDYFFISGTWVGTAVRIMPVSSRAIPTVCEWGLAVMVLLMMTTGSIVIARGGRDCRVRT
jgi:hypothetical protein